MSEILLSSTINTEPFNKAWIDSIVISGQPNTKTRAHITLKPYNGTNTLNIPKHLVIDDVFALAASDPQFGAVVQALLAEIARQATLNNVI